MRALAVIFALSVAVALAVPVLHYHRKAKPKPPSAALETPPPLMDFGSGTESPSCISRNSVSYYLSDSVLTARTVDDHVWTRTEQKAGPGRRDYRESYCAVAHDGTIYVLYSGEHSRLLALTPAGGFRWEMAFDGESGRPAIAADSTAYVLLTVRGSSTSELVAVSDVGTVKWQAKFPLYRNQRGGNATIGPNGTVYVESRQDEQDRGHSAILAFSPNGKIQWSTPAEDGVAISAIAPNGNIIASTSRSFFALRPDGTIAWTVATKPSLNGMAIVGRDNTAYLVSTDLVAVSSEGRVLWRFVNDETPEHRFDYFEGSPALAEDGTIYTGTLFNLYAVTPDGRKKWAIAPKGASCGQSGVLPLILNYRGTLYAGNRGARSPAPVMQGGWSMRNHDPGNTRSAQLPAQERKP